MIEQGRPVAERDGQAGDRGAGRLAGIHRRRVGRGHLADQLPAGHPGRRGGPLAQQVAQVRAGGAGHDVERPERQPVLGRRGDPGLMRAVERDGRRCRPPPGRWRPRPGRPPTAGHAPAPSTPAPRGAAAVRPPPAAGRPLRRAGSRPRWRGRRLPDLGLRTAHQLTWTEIWDMASASAFTAAASWRRWPSRTVEYSRYPVPS